MKGLTKGNYIKTIEGLVATFQTYNLSGETVFLQINNRLIEKSIDEIEGIIITDEWLQTFGFQQRYKGGQHEKWFNDQTLTVSIHPDLNCALVSCIDKIEKNANMSLRNFPIQHIHQLQNLFILKFDTDLQAQPETLHTLVYYSNHLAKVNLLIEAAKQDRLQAKYQTHTLINPDNLLSD